MLICKLSELNTCSCSTKILQVIIRDLWMLICICAFELWIIYLIKFSCILILLQIYPSLYLLIHKSKWQTKRNLSLKNLNHTDHQNNFYILAFLRFELLKILLYTLFHFSHFRSVQALTLWSNHTLLLSAQGGHPEPAQPFLGVLQRQKVHPIGWVQPHSEVPMRAHS